MYLDCTSPRYYYFTSDKTGDIVDTFTLFSQNPIFVVVILKNINTRVPLEIYTDRFFVKYNIRVL